MSIVLSSLILAELQKNNPNPQFIPQQKELANSIARAVQTYIASSVTVIGAAGPVPVTGKLLAP
jgi:hypothetical protein